MSESASLLLFGDEQISFPGIPRCAPPPPAPQLEDEPPPSRAGTSHCPGQLCLGPSQLLLVDADPEPLQPSLLPEPPPWEVVEHSSTRRFEGRLNRTAAARASGPPRTPARMRQLGLFSRHR
ncbi:MAG TPA: hypothetical protein VG779_10250 [Actinomycetota bacterium]|nr:hypothetical protein [Actinomycetota bacterium]